jgi:hypothetical protein
MASDSFGAAKRLPGKRFRSGTMGDALSEVYKDVEAGFVASELNGVVVLQQDIADVATADYDIAITDALTLIDVMVIKTDDAAGANDNTVTVVTAADADIHTAINMTGGADGAVFRMSAGYNDATAPVAAGGLFRIEHVKAGGNAACRVLLTCRRT